MRRNIFLFILLLLVSSILFAQTGYIRPDKIVMLWDYIDKKEDNLGEDKRIVHNGLDVVSPTWFSIGSEYGHVSSLASGEYVEWAHDNGIAVWAVFENSSDDLLTFRALSSASRRKNIIDQIAGLVREFNLDGINIDFESMGRETVRFFELFIAELYEKLKPMEITLSVDIPFPVSEILEIYNLELLSGGSDYLVLMAYNQHREDRAGPMAAIGWVRQGIEETLQYVPGEKLILGIPFFTRVWTENREGGASGLSSVQGGMKETYEMFDKAAGVWGRDRTTEQIYSEYEKDLKRYRVWLEDEHSISLKLDAINDYNLAGMSAWRRGWEWEEIWDMINAYFE